MHLRYENQNNNNQVWFFSIFPLFTLNMILLEMAISEPSFPNDDFRSQNQKSHIAWFLRWKTPKNHRLYCIFRDFRSKLQGLKFSFINLDLYVPMNQALNYGRILRRSYRKVQGSLLKSFILDDWLEISLTVVK